ncbi:MAG: TolC family protein [Chitinivibrionales bacterium]|nr:TolC family protein [Chitinivibrionales bacterium]
MKSVWLSLVVVYILVALNSTGNCQLTIEACQEKSRSRYPLIRQHDILALLENYTIDNANKGYLPQFSLSAKTTYQSDVTKLPIKLPGVQSLEKDQYQIAAEVSQILWDGGAIAAQKVISKATSDMEKQKLNVELFSLNDRVNQLFFGILLLAEQLIQNDILQKELQTNFTRVAAWMQNGIANQSDLNAIKVEQLNTLQRRTELLSTQRSYREMLSTLTGEPISESTELIKPDIQPPITDTLSINRPELALFQAQSALFSSQTRSLIAANYPKISLFVQGCFGRPGLNMLDNDFSFFYIAGLRFMWNFGSFYTYHNNLSKNDLSIRSIQLQKETFLFNTGLKVTQQCGEIDKYFDLIKNDDEIIALRSSIKKSAEAKVENGTISVTDLIREINAENLALQTKSLHNIQLLLAQYTLKNTINN